MKPSASLFALLLATLPLGAAEQIVTLGDSLTYAYEGEFGFRIVVPLRGTYGDNMPATVRNWIETLSSTTYRNASFDQGTRNTFELDFRPFGQRYIILLRNEYNWAIPGLKIDELRQFVLGEKTFLGILQGSENFSDLSTALAFSDFNETTDFNVAHLNDQIANSAERLVLFIGGNDVRTIYGTVYNGGSAGTFEEDFIADATVILDRVRQLKPGIQIVVAAVPHIGITPDIKSDFPTDAVKTERVTAVLRSLNARLETLAEEKGGGFADLFTPTLPMLGAEPYGIHGIAFANTGSATGDLNQLWLNGEFSANFHPNTNAQALIANIILEAFNRRYDTGIAPLTTTEILGGLLGKSAAQIDMNFASWSAGFGLTGQTESSDLDGDGIPASVEFATGLNPALPDGEQIRHRFTPGANPAFELVFPRRLPSSTRFTLKATTSTDLSAPFTAVTPTLGTDGLLRATIPASGRGFLRLESTVAP